MNLADVINPRSRQIDPDRVRILASEPPGRWTLEQLFSARTVTVRTHERTLSPGQGRRSDE